MSRVAYVNGRWVDQRLASVNIEDRGYQFGDGVYEVVHVYRGCFVDEDRHLARLDRSLREIRLPEPMPRAALLQVMRELVRRNRIAEGLLYMQVTRGVSRRDHAFPRRPVPPALVMTIKRIPPYPKDVDAWAASAITRPDLRWSRRDIKSVNLLPNVLARQEAREAGAIEAILFDEATGVVTEGAATSFWIVDEHGALRTRRLGPAILPGCTRDALVAELAERGVVLEVCPTSNVVLGVFGSYAEHPLPALREAGVPVAPVIRPWRFARGRCRYSGFALFPIRILPSASMASPRAGRLS